jgi:hypothetical protein
MEYMLLSSTVFKGPPYGLMTDDTFAICHFFKDQ